MSNQPKTKKAKKPRKLLGPNSPAHNDGVVALPNVRTAIAKQIDQVFPDKLVVTLKLISSGRNNIAIGTQAVGFRLRPTSAYDPTIGGGLTPVGFNPLAALYNSYRVSSSTYTLMCASLSSLTGMSVYLAPLNVDPGSSPTAATMISYADQTYGQVKMIGPLGSPVVTISKTMSTERIFGSKAVYFDDNFASFVTGNPTNNWYWGVAFTQDVPSPAQAAIVSWTQELWLTIEFFNRKRLDL